jgi:hypothetical protein
VQINVFNFLYGLVIEKLTEIENHRTDTEFENSMIVKLFSFLFVNSYSGFFYLAFVAQFLPAQPGADPSYLGQCGATSCMQPLAINLIFIYGIRVFVTVPLNFMYAYYTCWRRRRVESEGLTLLSLH